MSVGRTAAYFAFQFSIRVIISFEKLTGEIKGMEDSLLSLCASSVYVIVSSQ